MTSKKVDTLIRQQWGQMSEEQRLPYKKIYEQEMVKYNRYVGLPDNASGTE